MPFIIRENRENKMPVEILRNYGATKNFCKSTEVPSKRVKLQKPLKIESIHKTSKITYFYKTKIVGHTLIFYELKKLNNCDLILGLEGLKILNMQINFETNKITFIKKQFKTEEVNYTINSHVNPDYILGIEHLINGCVVITNLQITPEVL